MRVFSHKEAKKKPNTGSGGGAFANLAFLARKSLNPDKYYLAQRAQRTPRIGGISQKLFLANLACLAQGKSEFEEADAAVRTPLSAS